KLHRKRLNFLAVLIFRWMRLVYSCEIPYTCKIADDVVFAHKGLGVVINAQSVIESGTIIYQNVTIGNRRSKTGKVSTKGPHIGKNVLIGANAVIIGDIKIGDNAKIGAGAIVVKDVPENAVMVSEPAKMLTS